MEDLKKEISEEKGMDLSALRNKLWQKKKFVLKIVGIGAIVGLIAGFSIAKEYTTSVVLVPDIQSSSFGTIGYLATLAGINPDNDTGTDALASPDIYPDIINSSPFLQGLLDITVIDTEKNINTTLYEYLNDYQATAWWGYILNAPGLLKGLFSSDKKKLNNLKDRLDINSDKKTRVTTINLTMQSPEISAFLADSLTSYFQSYIINTGCKKPDKI